MTIDKNKIRVILLKIQQQCYVFVNSDF